MATYASLTAAQKAALGHATDSMARPLLGEFARFLNHNSAYLSEWAAGASAILATLGSTEVIPNQSGLAGAQDMTAAQWTSFAAALASLDTTYNTSGNRQNIALAAGGPNLIG